MKATGMRWRQSIRLGLKEKAHLDLVDGGTDCICKRCKETVHGEGTR